MHAGAEGQGRLLVKIALQRLNKGTPQVEQCRPKSMQQLCRKDCKADTVSAGP